MYPKAADYLDYLKKEGYVPEQNDNGDVVFKFEGATYVISVDAEDPQFFRLIFPNFWELSETADLDRALITANRINFMMKVGKILIVQENVWAVVELLLDSSPILADFIPRAMRIARLTAEEFGGAMKVPDIDLGIQLN